MEKRLLLAFVVSAVVFAVWSLLFPPAGPRRPAPGAERPVEPAAAVAGVEAGPPEPAPPAGVAPAEAAASEQTVELVNSRIRVELTNRGAAIRSFRLLGYQGDEGEPLELVQTVNHPERSLPLQLVVGEAPDERLYVVEEEPGAAVFRWADGLGSAASKRVSLREDWYGVELALATSGELEQAWLSLGTGLRDLGLVERDSRLARWGDAVFLADRELESLRRNKLKEARTITPAALGFAGLQDAYFLSVLRPASAVSEVRIEPLQVRLAGEGEQAKARPVLRVMVRPARGELRGELLGAPKEYRLLRTIGGGVERTLDFGIFGPISVLFLKALWWIYGRVGNYGVAIVLLTVAIRLILFPLMHASTVSMRKMQKLQPRLKEIQARHKKKKPDAATRAKLNQEIMALYKAEGVNPMGGCLPLLVQLPILWALYTLFLNAIELRHAPFVLWISDLSAKDPYYVTPVLMTATMWLQQRLAPQAGDPQQQRIMRLLPLIFGIMFLQFPSGLVLYWLTNNVIAILQQEVTLHLVGEGRLRKGKGSAR